MRKKSIDEIIEWPISEMKGCLIDNPDFTGEIHVKFATGGVRAVDVIENKPKPKKEREK